MTAAAFEEDPVLLAATMVALLAACSAGSSKTTKRAYQLPPVKHVFVIMLENESYSATFGDPSCVPVPRGAR